MQNNYTSLYRCNHFLSQFNLSQIKYNLLFNDIDITKELLTNKLIKSKYFKDILTKYKLKETSIIIEHFYNEIFNFIINLNASNFKRTNSTKIYLNEKYLEKRNFNDFSTNNTELINEAIYYINFIFDNSENTYKAKKIVINEFFKVLSIIFNKFHDISKSSLELLHKFMTCNFISEQNKVMLKFYYHSLIY